MSSNTLRSLIVSVSAETGAYQREMSRASRMGQNYLRTIADGNRQAAAGWRSQQSAINAQNTAMVSLTGSVGAYVSTMAGALALGNLATQADAWNAVNARLKQASSSTEDFANNQKVLFGISQLTGTAFVTTPRCSAARRHRCVNTAMPRPIFSNCPSHWRWACNCRAVRRVRRRRSSPSFPRRWPRACCAATTLSR